MIERNGERESGKSVQAELYDDNDDIIENERMNVFWNRQTENSILVRKLDLVLINKRNKNFSFSWFCQQTI